MMCKKFIVNKEKVLIIFVGDLYICVYIFVGIVMVFWFYGQKLKEIKDFCVSCFFLFVMLLGLYVWCFSVVLMSLC